MSEYDHHQQALLIERSVMGGDGWRAEVHKYSKTLKAGVSPRTNVVKWWQVHCYNVPPSIAHSFVNIDIQDHAKEYPTLVRMALDILPIQASSVPCEHLFSSSKQVVTEHHSHMGSDCFKELLIMKSMWHDTITNWAAINSEGIEQVNLMEYEELLDADVQACTWGDKDKEQIFESDFE
jgi:hypothetical protein